MKINTLTTIVLTLGTTASIAHAQNVIVPAEKSFRIAVGTYNPMATSTKEIMGATLPMISLSYDAGKSTSEKPMIYGVYFDFAQNRHSGTNNSVTAFGVSARYLSRAPLTNGRYFIGGGVGSYDV